MLLDVWLTWCQTDSDHLVSIESGHDVWQSRCYKCLLETLCVKVRKTFMSGHMQGDWTALSYFQRWLTEKHLSREAGTIWAVEIYEVNTGLMQPLAYTSLMAVKDNRKYGKRKNQLLKTLERAQISALESQTALERRRREEFTEEHCVRNY